MPRQNCIDDECLNLSPAQVKAGIATSLISALSDKCKTYCILSGYEQLPNSFDTDIDFMVDEDDFQRMPGIMEEIARQTKSTLLQSVAHEITACAFFLVSLRNSQLTIVQLDSASDYRHFGALWLRAGEVLAARRRHLGGFWIPSAAHEFAYYLIKRLNKRDFNQKHGSRLHKLYVEDSDACERMIARFWAGKQRSALNRMAASNDWAELSVTLEPLRRELMRNTAESLAQKFASSPKRLLHFIDRVARPTGGWIAFIGPDGCGKSSVISVISRQFAPSFRDVMRIHMRPRIFSRKSNAGATVSDPHGQPPRGLVASVTKVFYFAADYLLGFIFQILPALCRTRLIIFDRYIYDLLVDSRRVRYGGPGWLLRLAAGIVPRPNLTILLDAPAEVLWSRKQEVPFSEVARQRAAYLLMARNQPATIVVNAAQPLADVIKDIDGAIVAHFSRRTAERLELQVALPPLGRIDSDVTGSRC